VDAGFGLERATTFPAALGTPSSPRITADQTRILYARRQTQQAPGFEIVSSAVSDSGVDFNAVADYPQLNTPDNDFCTGFAADQTMYVYRSTTNLVPAYTSAYAAPVGSTYGPGTTIPGLAGSTACGNGCFAPVVSRDQLTLYVVSAGANITVDPNGIYVFRRDATNMPFVQGPREAALPVKAIPTWLSADECRLYFFEAGPTPSDGGTPDFDLYVAEKPN
jgi:hypothetical protein